MLVPYNWLREWVDLKEGPEELAQRLTLTGLEVEGVFNAYEDLAPVTVVRVVSVAPHPHAEKLKVCQVSDGERDYQVVCGAPNVREGLKTAFAPPGTVLFTGEKISEAEIRGVRSEGVLCSPYELGVEAKKDGLIAFSDEVSLGRKVIEVLDLYEPVLEVAVTPNRGDCLSIYGLAREAAAVTESVLRPFSPPSLPLGEEIFAETSVVIEVPELCFRYAGRLIKGVQVSESPFEIQKRLWFCGLRPINNVVDVTNYVLLLLGQPLHAFDFDLLEGRRIIVRRARPGEKILTLDGVERTLDEGIMVIADASRPVAVAGIMGGEETAVTGKTKNIFLESAWFNPSSIRRSSQRLKLSSESSYRFERGVDPEGVIRGLELAASLIQELAGGEIVPGRVDEYPRPYVSREIRLSPKRVSLYLKVDLPQEKLIDLLEKVEVKVERGVEDLICVPPSYRHDLTLPEDLIEEIARLYGYDKLPVAVPRAEIVGRPPRPFDRLLRRAREILTALGLFEVINYSFISPRFVSLLGLEDDPRARTLSLANPLSEEQAVMRTTLIPGLLQTARVNVFREVPDLKIFEIGRVFWPREGEPLPEERHFLAGLLCGRAHPPSCHQKPRLLDFYDLKGVLESFFHALGVRGLCFEPGAGEPFLLAGLSVALKAGEEKIGFAGALRDDVLEKLDLPGPIFVFELDFEKLCHLVETKKTYQPLPKFPATFRDLALVVPEELPAGDVLAFARELSFPHLEDVQLIDVYRGKGVPVVEKSLTLRFVYRAKDRTLRDEEVNDLHQQVTEAILSHFKAKLR